MLTRVSYDPSFQAASAVFIFFHPCSSVGRHFRVPQCLWQKLLQGVARGGAAGCEDVLELSDVCPHCSSE